MREEVGKSYVPSIEVVSLYNGFAGAIKSRTVISKKSRDYESDLSDATSRAISVYTRETDIDSQGNIGDKVIRAASIGEPYEYEFEEFGIPQFEGAYVAYERIGGDFLLAGYEFVIEDITKPESSNTYTGRLIISTMPI